MECSALRAMLTSVRGPRQLAACSFCVFVPEGYGVRGGCGTAFHISLRCEIWNAVPFDPMKAGAERREAVPGSVGGEP